MKDLVKDTVMIKNGHAYGISDDFLTCVDAGKTKLLKLSESIECFVGNATIAAILRNKVKGLTVGGLVITAEDIFYKNANGGSMSLPINQISSVQSETDHILIHLEIGTQIKIDDLINCQYQNLAKFIEEVLPIFSLSSTASQKKEISAEWSNSLLLGIINQNINFNTEEISDDFYVHPNIPEKKLKNAAEAMEVKYKPAIAAIYDSTLFGSASDGFIIETTQFIYKALWSDPLTLNFSEIDGVIHVNNGKKDHLLIRLTNGQHIQVDDLTHCNYKALEGLLAEIIEKYKQRKTDKEALPVARTSIVNALKNIDNAADQIQEKENALAKVTEPKKKLPIAPDEFVVAVIAPMSSGKSTTLNAMLGVPLLPTKNQACTAITTKITDIDGLTKFHARTLQKDGLASGWQSLSVGSSQLSEWNNGSCEAIEIQGDFPNIDNHAHRITFLDTPGPNNSTNLAHGEITHNLLSESAFTFLMFVLNATQFGVDDERALLKKVANWIKEDSDHSKIVFLVNKIDELDPEKGECPERHVDRVKGYLEETGFQTPTIIPGMSKLALELRSCLTAHKTKTELPFSLRAQRRIAHEVDHVLQSRDSYSSAFKYVSNAKTALSPLSETAENIRLAERDFTLQEIMEAEIITGIPILERCLQENLAAHPVPNLVAI